MNKVKVKNIIKKILLILIATAILILGGKVFTEAGTVDIRLGGTVSLDLGRLEGTKDRSYPGQILYCVSHSGGFNHGQFRSYRAVNYRKIIGTSVYNRNGSLIDTNPINAKFAYVLGGGTCSKGYGYLNRKSDRQLAVWHTFNAWVAKDSGISGWRDAVNAEAGNTHESRKLMQQAEDYSENTGTSEEASIESRVGETIITSNTNAGPFNFKYSGRIQSINVYDSDGHEIPSRNISFIVNNRIASITDIDSQKDFYISNSSDKRLGKLTVTVVPGLSDLIRAEIWFLDSGSTQRLIAAKTETTQPVPKSASVNIKTYGSLTLKKIDQDTGEELKNAGFKIKTSKGWLKGSAGNYKYNATKGRATIYKSGSENKIKELNFDTYHIYEVQAPDGYKLEYQNGYDSDKKWIDFGTAKIDGTDGHEDVEKTMKNDKSGNINIYKEDFDTKEKLKGAGFKIFSVDDNGWVGTNSDPNSKEKYIYNLSYENATEYYTDEDGKLEIKEINLGKYQIYETKGPDGYDLTAQLGYDGEKVLVKSVRIDSKSNEDTDVATSMLNEKVISISGYIWKDTDNGKQEELNNLYDQEENYSEEKIANIPVSLIDKSTQEVIDTKLTDENGQYKFDGHDYIKTTADGHKEHLIREETITNYYVKFDYSRIQKDINNEIEYDSQNNREIRYIPVAFNSENLDEIDSRGSRAVMDNVAECNKDLSGIATTYTGRDKEEKYGLGANGNLYKKLYNNKNFTLENINLGIKELPPDDYSIDENINYVKIKMKGYEYTYEYGSLDKDTGELKYEAVPTVNFQNKTNIRAYTHSVYPSFLAYDVENSSTQLEAYVGYNITIKNTTTFDIPELYQEQKLYVTSLKDEFDDTRYTLNDTNWTASGKTATIRSEYLNQVFGDGISKDADATVAIEFKVKHEAILKILNSPFGIIEDFPTKAISDAYHKYQRIDYSWKNVNETNSINRNGNPATHTTTQPCIKTATAPYMIFKLGEERELNGVVFEDSQDNPENATTNEKLGDGIYSDEKENVVKGVKVELLDLDSDQENDINAQANEDFTKLKVSHLYDLSKLDLNPETPATEAVTTTDEEGKYTFKGVVPGRYFLRYTYADGKQKIYAPNGDKINATVSVKNYKSTIVTSNDAKLALKKDASILAPTDAKKEEERERPGLWYKRMLYKSDDDNRTNYSVAVDSMSSVANAQDGNPNEVMAGTAMISITIENTENDRANIKDIERLEGTNRIFPGFNFGIIRRPETHLETDKKITNMRLVNAQGNVIFDGNPETGNLTGVSDLDYTKNKGSSFARIEMDENQLYGSTLTLTYTITITNHSDVNYYGEKYYWFGEDKNNQVTVTPITISDYMDTTLTYMSVSEGKNVVQDNNNIKKIIINKDEQEVERKLLKVTGFKELYTTMNSNNSSEVCQDSVEITTQRVLSSNDNDMILYNTEILTDLDSTTGDPQKDNGWKSNETSLRDLKVVETDYDNNVKNMVPTAEQEQNGTFIKAYDFENSLKLVSGSTVTITPPTGADKISPVLYIATGAIALVILSLGVVIIKKKILK